MIHNKMQYHKMFMCIQQFSLCQILTTEVTLILSTNYVKCDVWI